MHHLSRRARDIEGRSLGIVELKTEKRTVAGKPADGPLVGIHVFGGYQLRRATDHTGRGVERNRPRALQIDVNDRALGKVEGHVPPAGPAQSHRRDACETFDLGVGRRP